MKFEQEERDKMYGKLTSLHLRQDAAQQGSLEEREYQMPRINQLREEIEQLEEEYPGLTSSVRRIELGQR